MDFGRLGLIAAAIIVLTYSGFVWPTFSQKLDARGWRLRAFPEARSSSGVRTSRHEERHALSGTQSPTRYARRDAVHEF